MAIRKVNFEDIDSLTNATAKFMFNNDLNDLEGGHGKESYFYKIVEINNKINFNEKTVFNLYVKWKRNDQDFRTKVLKKLKMLKTEKKEPFGIKFQNYFEFLFDSKEWDLISKYTSVSSRPSLLVEASNIISKKLRLCGQNCKLKIVKNRFMTAKRRIPGHKYWKGIFKCLLCKREIEGFIEKRPEKNNPVLLILKTLVNSCEGIIGKIRLDKEERINLQKEAFSKGATNFKIEALLDDDKIKLAISNDSIRKMRSEFAHRFKLDHDLRVDCDKAKAFFEFEYPAFNKNSIEGFIHDVSSDPFGAIFLSEYQVKIWANLYEIHPIWYFDATGGILKKIITNKDTLLFSLVVHDKINKINLPIAEFVTNLNNNVSIFGYLHKILEKFKCYKFFKLPKVIVTDFSWANLHATMKVFNNMDVISYLKLSFQLLVEEKEYALRPINTMIYLCSTHFLKNVNDDAKKELKYKNDENSNEALKLFLDAFYLLQNSVCINQFIKILNCTRVILTSKSKNNHYLKNYALLSSYFLTKDIEMFSHVCSSCKNFQESNEKKQIFFVDNTNISYVKDSPFTEFFERMNSDLEIEQGFESNNFYFPKLYEIIKRRLHLLPLWSGIMFKKFGIGETRLSNNYVEKWFHDLKIDILQRNKRVNKFQLLNISEVSMPVYFHLKNAFLKYYEDSFNIKFNDFGTKNNNNLQNNLSFEKWSNGKKKLVRKIDPLKKKDMINIESGTIRNILKKIKLSDIESIEELTETQMISSLSIKEPEDNKEEFTEKYQMFNNDLEENIEYMEIFEDKLSSKSSNLYEIEEESKNEDINITVSSLEDQPIDSEVGINLMSCYGSDTNFDDFFFYKVGGFAICKRDIRILLENKWLSSELLMAYAECMNKLSKILIIDSFYSTDIFNNGTLKFHRDFQFEKYNQVFGFIFVNENHWTCFYVKISENKLFYLDPMGETKADQSKMIRNWIKFANDYPYLAKKKWKLDNIDHPIQTDGSNCGVYVCRFLEEIINGKKKFIFDNSPGELIRYRQKICYVLKTNSSKNFCSFCGRTISQTDEVLKDNCSHLYHLNCNANELKSKKNFICPLCY